MRVPAHIDDDGDVGALNETDRPNFTELMFGRRDPIPISSRPVPTISPIRVDPMRTVVAAVMAPAGTGITAIIGIGADRRTGWSPAAAPMSALPHHRASRFYDDHGRGLRNNGNRRRAAAAGGGASAAGGTGSEVGYRSAVFALISAPNEMSAVAVVTAGMM